MTAGTLPAVCRCFRLRCALLRTHLEQLGSIHTACLPGHAHAHETSHRATGIGSRGLHCFALSAHHVGTGHIGITEDRGLLQFLNHGLVFLGCLHGGYTHGNNLHTAQILPLGRKYLIHGFRHFHGMTGQCGITDAHIRNSGKSRLQCGQQFRLQLAVDLGAVIVCAYIAADIGVEQNGVGNPVGILTEATDGNIHIQSDVAVHHAERHRTWRTVLVAHDFLGVDVIDPLILGRFAAEGEALADGAENIRNALAQIACHDRRFRGRIVDVLTLLCAQLHHLALLHDQHALSVRNRNDTACGNNIIRSLGIGGTAGNAFTALDHQCIRIQCVTIKIFLPLVSQNTACCSKDCFQKSHSPCSFRKLSTFSIPHAVLWCNTKK